MLKLPTREETAAMLRWTSDTCPVVRAIDRKEPHYILLYNYHPIRRKLPYYACMYFRNHTWVGSLVDPANIGRTMPASLSEFLLMLAYVS